MKLMPIEHIPDWEQRLARQDAFWDCALIDRPVVNYALWQENPEYPAPTQKTYASQRDRWMDSAYIAECATYYAMNTVYGGDALPHFDPNLGPEVFSAFFGTELEYGESTSWSIANLHDWDDVSHIKFSEDNFYWKKILEMTDVLLEAGNGKFYTGITDLHPGGDAIVAFRDPLNMNMDMLDAPEQIQTLLPYINKTFFHVIDTYFDKLQAVGQAISCWAGIVTSRRYYVPSNDFSCMISKEMFNEIFLPGIIEECRHLEASIYHLDGPNALQHLDSLLDIPELNAIQWVYGSGNGRASDWLDVYKKCQTAGKGLQISLELDEIDLFMQELRPEGLWLTLYGVQTAEEGRAIEQKFMQWK